MMEELLLQAWEDPRFQRLTACTAGWMVVWTTVLVAVPAGASGRNHIVSLNAAHGVVCTLVAAATIYFRWDTANSVAISLGYFLVDLVAMVKSDGLQRLASLNRSRVMDYVHHFLGIFWGTIFYAHEATVCSAALGNPYVWIQTNEVSTPFYNWFRLTNSAVAGALFISLFFLSRIVFNTFYVIPRLVNECDTRYLWGCLPFFALQYVWFVMIVKKLQRTLRSKGSDKDTSKRD